MKVFVSWSGSRSKLVAQSLRGWLPKVLQSVKPWMSDRDIEVGVRWFPEISEQLESSNFGIVCLTQENREKPWLMFEAGALAKKLSESFVCPYLFDLEQAQIAGPPAQFQSVKADEEGTQKLLGSMNKLLGDAAIPGENLAQTFKLWWPELLRMLNAIPSSDVVSSAQPKRSDEEILAEILTNTREILRLRKDDEMKSRYRELASTISESLLPSLSDPPSSEAYENFLRRFEKDRDS